MKITGATISLKKKQSEHLRNTDNAALISGGGTWRGLKKKRNTDMIYLGKV